MSMTDTKMTNEMATGAEDDVVDLTDEQAPEAEAQETDEQPQETPETEAEPDALAEQVDALRRTVVDSIVTEGGMGGRMHSAEPFWAGGIALTDLLDEDGDVDRAKVLAAADDIAVRFGITRRPKPTAVPNEGYNPAPRGRDSMVNVVRGKR